MRTNTPTVAAEVTVNVARRASRPTIELIEFPAPQIVNRPVGLDQVVLVPVAVTETDELTAHDTGENVIDVGPEVTENAAVAVVLLSSTVSVPVVVPLVSVNVAAVLLVTTIEAIADPVTPDGSVKSVAAVSLDHSVFVPVAVTVSEMLSTPDVRLITRVAVATDMVPVRLPSETVSVPVPDPVVITSVAAVADVITCETFAAPITPETENDGVPGVPEFHDEPVPVSVRVILPPWLAGTVDGAAAIPPLTVNAAVWVVLASVIVSVPAAVPFVSVNVADVLLVTTIEAIEEPATPATVNNVAAVSLDHSVFVPVAVTVSLALALAFEGLIESVAVAIVTLAEEVPSLIVSVPVLDPVVTTTVAAPVPVMFCETFVTPDTPDRLNVVVPEVQFVPVPASVRVILPLWLAGTVDGDDVKDSVTVA